jgi:hypothetical protein
VIPDCIIPGVDNIYLLAGAVALIFAWKKGLLGKKPTASLAKTPLQTESPAKAVLIPDISEGLSAYLEADARLGDQEAAAAMLAARRRSRDTEALQRALQRRTEPQK